MKSASPFLLVALLSAVLAGWGANAAEDEASLQDSVIALNARFEQALVGNDAAFLGGLMADNFTFTHGDGWTAGHKALKIDTKAETLSAAGAGRYVYRKTNNVHADIYDDVAVLRGGYEGRAYFGEDAHTFTVHYVRVFAQREGRWRLLSHLTVKGPHFEGGVPAAVQAAIDAARKN